MVQHHHFAPTDFPGNQLTHDGGQDYSGFASGLVDDNQEDASGRRQAIESGGPLNLII